MSDVKTAIDSHRRDSISDIKTAIMDAAERRMQLGGFGGFSFRENSADIGIVGSDSSQLILQCFGFLGEDFANLIAHLQKGVRVDWHPGPRRASH